MPNPIIPPIPPAAIAALQAAGVKDIALMSCIDKDGNTHILKGDRVTDHPDATFPIKTSEIQSITPISVVKYTGSTCITYVQGGTLYTICW